MALNYEEIFGDDFLPILKAIDEGLPDDVERMVLDRIDQVVFRTDIFSDEITRTVQALASSGVSQEQIENILAQDMANGGKIFGGLRNGVKEEIVNTMNQASRLGQFEEYGLQDNYMWVTVGGHKICSDCDSRAGKVKSYDDWAKEGLPGSGWSLCGGYCYCVIDPVGKMDTNIKVPKEIKAEKGATVRPKVPLPPTSNKLKFEPKKINEEIFREWSRNVEDLKPPQSLDEAFHQWSTFNFTDYKKEFFSGKLTSRTTQYIDDAFKSLDGNHNGSTVYRGMASNKKELRDYISNLKVGDEIVDNLPSSYSKSKDVADQYTFNYRTYSKDGLDIPNLIDGEGVMVQFRAKNITRQGFDISENAYSQWEQEILVKPGSKFKVTNVTKKRQVIKNSQNELIDINGNNVEYFDVYLIDIEPIQ